ncbi:hypothetical protein DM194_27710 (plasmid) [Azospirillum ramasamyi]|uniref:DUF4258 domain-containing protein n=1 Tax=Azospirillum ramasamyi TaxID=682998 RepID=A0A2U9SH95_9PROT|nr:hypothetical protein DM194_27710 [Azospirillum ramasamyi]
MSAAGRGRAQQRAIPPFIVDLLLRFGAEAHHHGAEVLYFDKEARRRLRHHLGDRILQAIGDQMLDTYAAVGEGDRVVTVAHRNRRLKRP